MSAIDFVGRFDEFQVWALELYNHEKFWFGVLLSIYITSALGMGISHWVNECRKNVGLRPGKWTSFKLTSKTPITHNTCVYRFALQNPQTTLGLPVGKHMSLKGKHDGEDVKRPYTPISSDDDKGYFDLLIKTYPKGKFTQWLDKQPVGSMVPVMGPQGHINYDRASHFAVHTTTKNAHFDVQHINMIAGGTGITPMYQIIQQIIKHRNNGNERPSDHTKVTLIFGNQSIDDILLHDELLKIRKLEKDIKIYFTLDKKPVKDDWSEGIGYVTQEMIEQQCFKPSDVCINLLCGPGPLCKGAKKALLALGHEKRLVHEF